MFVHLAHVDMIKSFREFITESSIWEKDIYFRLAKGKTYKTESRCIRPEAIIATMHYANMPI